MSRRLSPADVRAGTPFASRSGDPRFVRAEQAPLRHAGEATNPLTIPPFARPCPHLRVTHPHPSASRANVFPRRINHGSRVHRVRDPPPSRMCRQRGPSLRLPRAWRPSPPDVPRHPTASVTTRRYGPRAGADSPGDSEKIVPQRRRETRTQKDPAHLNHALKKKDTYKLSENKSALHPRGKNNPESAAIRSALNPEWGLGPSYFRP